MNYDTTTIERFNPEKKGPGPAWKIAEEILTEVMLVQDESGTFYEYLPDQGYWCRRNDYYMIHLVHRYIPKRSHPGKAEIVKYIGAKTHDAKLKFGRVADNEVAALNGVINIDRRTLRSHDPANMLDSVIPHDYVDGAQCPRFLEALESWTVGDAQRFYAIQEFFGYTVLSHARYKKALLIYGIKNAGKSSLLKIMRALVGDEWCCSLPVGAFDDPVRLCAIMHKRLNVVTETSSNEIIKGAGFKTMISTEEAVEINPKFKHPISYVPTAKHVIACNELPRILDPSGATVDRLLLVPFDKEVPEDKRDDGLVDAIIAEEMPGILCFAIEGACDLVARHGRFSTVDASRQKILDLIDESNPLIAFVAAEMFEDADARTPLIDIAKRYNKEHYGRQVDARSVGRHLRNAFGDDCTKHCRVNDQQTAKCFVGYRLSQPKVF